MLAPQMAVRRRKAAQPRSPLFSTNVWHPGSVFDYYVGLLAFRKLYFKVFESDFEKAHGRPPTEEEWCQGCKEVCGAGGLGLADEGRRRQSDPSLFDEERLLTSAFIDAICLGTDVIVLTRNPLVMDQFARLAYLMRQHYIAVVLADQVADEPGRIALCQTEMPPNTPRTTFTGDMEVAQITDAELQSMLPERPYHVNLHCWLFAGNDKAAPRVSVMSFCGERPMVRLLQTKATTGGRNTNRFEDRNVHVVGLCGSPQNTQIAIVADRLIGVGSRHFPEDERLVLTQREYPAVDLVHVINRGLMPDIPSVLGSA